MNPLYVLDELPLCLQIHSCSTLWHRLTPPMSPDIHFTVIFPYSSNLTFVNNGKDSSLWEGKLVLWALWEITSKLFLGVIAIPRVFRKERWWAVTLSLFKGLQMKFSSLSSLCSQLPNFFFKGKMFFTEERDVEVSSDDMLYDSSSLAMG